MAIYLLAVRREARATVPSDWIEQVSAYPDVIIHKSESPHLIQIEADSKSIALIRHQLGHYLHIEPPVENRPAIW